MASTEDTRSVTTGDAGKEGNGKAPVPAGMAASFYKASLGIRQPYLDRARRVAGLTMPALFPPVGQAASGADEELPWNSGGAYLLTNLGAKVTRSMFPIGIPPMKLSQSRAARKDLIQLEATDPDHAQELKTQIDEGLSVVEGEFSDVMEEDGDRAHLSVTTLKMLCGGSHGLQFYPDGRLRGISLDRFVTQRDPSGKLLRFCIEDPMEWAALDEDVQDICTRNGYQVDETAAQQPEIMVYTHGQLVRGQWQIFQETFSERIPDTFATYNLAAMPYLFLPWQLLPGEHYGRSYGEFYEADLDLVDGFTKTVAEGSAAVARFITMVSPTGLTSKKALAEAANGAVITGREEDVHTLENNKEGDFQTANAMAEATAQRLGRAFLVTSAVVRNAERVTAEEIHRLAGELEEVLGGVYSEQVVTFQIPYVTKKLRYAMQQDRVTRLPKDTISLKVIGGAAALGRNANLIALDQYVGGALQTLGPQVVLQAINPREYMARRAAALGIETHNLIYTEEQAAQQAQQNTAQEAMKTLGPALIQGMAGYKTSTDVAGINADAKIATAAPPAQTLQ